MLKSLYVFLFYLHMLDQTQHNLISPFWNDTFFKTGIHFRFQGETLRVN